MRRNATKVAAVVMSLAVTMTSVNLPTTAAAATKKVKLNKTKATLTVGKTTTLKVTKGGKAVKATFKSSNAKVAKVVTKSGKSTKIKALKKGTAKITATYAKKKYTCKITVKAKKVTATTAPTVEPTVAPTETPVVDIPTTAPATDAALETKKNAAKIEFRLTNAYDENHQDTVLVGTNANLKARVLDEDGKPVANAPVVLTSRHINGKNYFGNLTHTTLTSDSEGYVTFVFGLGSAKDENGYLIDSMRWDLIGSYNLTATVAGSNVQTDMTLKFGAIKIESEDYKEATGEGWNYSIDVVNAYESDKVRGDVRKGLTKSGDADYALSTTTVNDNSYENRKNVEYVSSQKVSTTGVDNSVTFSSAAYLVMPSDDKLNTANTIEKVCGDGITEYSNYQAPVWSKVVDDVNASKLKNATVIFDKINISKHTKLTLKAFLTEKKDGSGDAKQVGSDLVIGSDTADVNYDNYSWQIPLSGEKGYLKVEAKIEAEGQVNADNNKGIKVNKIVGVYNKSSAIDNYTRELAKDVKVNWEIAKNVTYTIPQPVIGTLKEKLDAKTVTKADGTTPTFAKEGFTYTYTVPAFPHTGNAIITVKNKKGEVYTYYSADTVNNGRNVNIIDESAPNLYEISETETKDSVGAEIVKATDTRVTIDSQTTGITHVVGTIESNNKDVKIDASNKNVYSSVQWNPINVNSDKTAVGYAFVGQNIKVVAQLKDQNGNDVNKEGKSIDFTANGANIKTGNSVGVDSKVKVLSISNEGKTNAKGQVEMVVSSESVDQLLDMVATTNSGYNVSFSLNGKDTNSKFLELYWLDLDLLYTSCVFNYDRKNILTSSTDFDLTETVAPNVGGNWSYGVKVVSKNEISGTNNTVGNSVNKKAVSNEGNAELNGYTVEEITGVNTKVSVEDGYAGNYTVGTNSITNASTAQGATKALFQIVPTSVTDSAKVVFKKGDTTYENAYYAGNGTTTIDKRFRFNINWGTGAISSGNFLLPTGRYVAIANNGTDDDLKAYFQLVDKYGNPIKNEKVTLTTTDSAAILESTKLLNRLSFDKIEAETDDKGMIILTVAKPIGNTTILSATVDGTTYSKSYEWRKDQNGFEVDTYAYDSAKKQLVIKFNDEVVAGSITKDMLKDIAGDGKLDRAIKFYATGVASGVVKSFNAKDVTVNGKVVTITLPDTFNETIANESEFVIDFSAITIDGIDYVITSAETGAKVNNLDNGKLTIKF